MSSTLCNITLMGDEVMLYNPSPSETIYYHEFPYRIAFEQKISDDITISIHRRKKAYKDSLYAMLQDFFYNSDNKSRIRFNGYNVYFEDYNHFVETLHMFSAIVERCLGPVSAEHLAMLQNKTYSLEVRPNIYYKKYDSKLSVFTPYFRFGGIKQTRQLASEIREFLRSQFEQDTIRMQRQWTLGTDLYINYDDWITVYPFFKLNFPDAKVKLTRCFLYDK